MYSAIHLNVPVFKITSRDRTRSKLLWLLYALLAPELVVYLAWSQRREAKVIAWAFNEATGRSQTSKTWIRRLTDWLRKRRSQDKHPENALKDDPHQLQPEGQLDGSATTTVHNQEEAGDNSSSSMKVSEDGLS